MTGLVQRLVLGATLGLGALDVVWIDLSLAPRALASDSPAAGSRDPEAHAPDSNGGREPEAHAPDSNGGREPEARTPRQPDVAGNDGLAVTAAASASPAATQARAPEPVRDEVYFATASARLDAPMHELLEQLAASAPAHVRFVLVGHADHRGEAAFNRSLSHERAAAVRARLVELGIAAARVEVRARGEADARPSGQLWRDRRVDIEILGGSR